LNEYTIKEMVRDLICEAYFESRFERRDDVISVTEVTQCLRYSYFARKEPRCVPQSYAMLLGIAGHRLFLSKLERLGFMVEKLVAEKRDGIKLVGRCDAWHPDLDIVLELKTCFKPPDEPYDDHVFQVRIYGALLKARKLYIVYIPRDGINAMKVFYVHPDRKVLDEAFARAKKLIDALKTGEPPDPERGRWCRYCPYAFTCRKSQAKARPLV